MPGGTIIPDELVPAFEQAMAQGVTYGPMVNCHSYNMPPPPLRAFLVRYKGLWLGGKAIVLADCADTACDMVREDKRTIKFDRVEASELGSAATAGVIYNDNGDC